MPFGLTNAPATFQRALDIILSGVKWQSCLIYLDDVIVYSKMEEEHIGHVDHVLRLLREAGGTLRLPKCRFFRTTVEYLGHEIKTGRLGVMNAHTRALREEHFPTTRTHLRSFVGMCNVFRRFVPNFSRMAAPLTDLMGSTAPVLVPPATPLQQQAFDRLKEALTTPPVLALPRCGRKYVLDVDACGTHLGAALLHEQDDGKLQPVAYISRRLATNELPYGVTEKEFLAVVWASLKLRPYLEGDHFLVHTDHDWLRWILNTEGSRNPRLARWRLRLSELESDVVCKPGMTHYLADSIFRLESGASDETAFVDAVPVFATRANTVRGLDAADYVGGPTVRGIKPGRSAIRPGRGQLLSGGPEGLERWAAHPVLRGPRGDPPPPRGPRRRSRGGGPGLLAGAGPSPRARRDPRGTPRGVPHVRGNAAVLLRGGHGGGRRLLR